MTNYIVYRVERGVKKILLQTVSRKRALTLKKSCKFKAFVEIRKDKADKSVADATKRRLHK